MLTISKGVSWTPSQHHSNINTVCLLLVCQMFMSSAWMCHVAVFYIFLYKAMWSKAYGYYSAVAGHSVALKQFSPSSCIQELIRKETYYLLTKTYLCKTYLYKFNVACRYYKIWMVNFSMICLSTGFMVVLEHYCSCDWPLQWNQSCRELV